MRTNNDKNSPNVYRDELDIDNINQNNKLIRSRNTYSRLCNAIDRIKSRQFRLGIIGLGYVGLPLACAATKANFNVVGFDIDQSKVAQLNQGLSPLKHIPDTPITIAVQEGLFEATCDFSVASKLDGFLICVPTPLTAHREPDLSCVERTVATLAPHLRPGQLIVLESTTYPGTTRGLIASIIEKAGLVADNDIWLAYSPEREDPGNSDFETSTIPKVIGGDCKEALMLAQELYGAFVRQIVPVSSTSAAEAVKLTENIFRAVNIALVNELKIVFNRMAIDVWEVIEAARTKPFGYMAFYPGPGLGGHCIPIDPFYLTWKAREFGISTRFIELAGEINTMMPRYVVDQLAEALDRQLSRGINGATVLVLGVAYKKNIDDIRESPSLILIELLKERGAEVIYHDPHVPIILSEHMRTPCRQLHSVDLEPAMLSSVDVALIATDHDAVDYQTIVKHCRLIIDTRNATHGLAGNGTIIKA